MRKPTIVFEAYNTPGRRILSVGTISNDFLLPNLKGRATSEPVQFNMNRAATAGTIFVNENNDGLCVAHTTSKRFAFTKAKVKISPGGSNPLNIDEAVKFDQGTILSDGRTVIFNVHRIDSTVGNITLIFQVEYKLAL